MHINSTGTWAGRIFIALSRNTVVLYGLFNKVS